MSDLPNRIIVLKGGISEERSISLKTGAAVANALRDKGYDVTEYDWSLEHDQDLAALHAQKAFDIAFIALHGTGGEDGYIQRLLDQMALPYTGSNAKTSEVVFDKLLTKQVWLDAGVSTPPHKVLSSIAGQYTDESGQIYDSATFSNLKAEWQVDSCFVKPVAQGSSVGMTKVDHKADLLPALEAAFAVDDKVLIEPFIAGKELTMGFVGGKWLPAIEIQTEQAFYNYEAKYLRHDTKYLCPAPIAENILSAFLAMAKKSVDVLGVKNWGRVDARLDSKGKAWLLEVNTIPGLTETSLVPKSAKVAGVEFSALVESILLDAYSSYQESR